MSESIDSLRSSTAFELADRAPTVPLYWMHGLYLLGLIAALYWPVTSFPFVNWDDPWYVTNNQLIKSWHPASLWRVATESVARNYAPLTILSLLGDHSLFGLDAGGYHTVNVLLHLVNALLVYQLVSRLAGSTGVGLATAALFAVHPVQIESVAWVSSRKTLLSSTFMLCSLLCWLRPERTGRQELWGTVFLMLGLLSKASAVSIPPIVVAYDALVLRKSLKQSIPRQILPAFLCVLLINLTMSSQTTIVGGIRSHIGLSKLQLLGVDAVILWRYVGMLIAPLQLCVLYDQPTSGIGLQIALSIVGWTVVAWVCWRLRHVYPLVTFAAATWLLLLIPMLNLFPLTTLMNDRYLYLPCVCLFAVATAVLLHAVSWTSQQGRNRNLLRLLGSVSVSLLLCGVLLFHSVLTMHRLQVWSSDLVLWEDAAASVPQLCVVQIQLADALHRRGRITEAVVALTQAMAHCDPDDADCERITSRLNDWR